ncbi:MAG TPA: hypothetical protein PLB03_08415, partial [Candidatus Fimenecus sp.]|nr:hypothetical protein [Candidatus Fimenecus sp.]
EARVKAVLKQLATIPNAVLFVDEIHTIIGAGSVVTKDIPENVVAYGNPCRVAREINEHDREFYYKDRRITKEIFDEIKNI